MLHDFQVNFSNMIGIVDFRVIPIYFMKRFPVRTIGKLLTEFDRLTRSQCLVYSAVMFSSIQPAGCFRIVLFSFFVSC